MSNNDLEEVIKLKLNHDCVRDLLLTIEELDSRTQWVPIEEIADRSNLSRKGYTLDELSYTAVCLTDRDYIKAEITFEGGTINRLTMDGHNFLDNIRDPFVWKETKKAASKLTSVSIGMLSEISIGFIKKLVANSFN